MLTKAGRVLADEAHSVDGVKSDDSFFAEGPLQISITYLISHKTN